MSAAHAREPEPRLLDDLGVTMNRSRAIYVRWLRTHNGCTWAAVGRECAEQWGHDWPIAQRAPIGREICEVAALLLDEDPNADPWN